MQPTREMQRECSYAARIMFAGKWDRAEDYLKVKGWTHLSQKGVYAIVYKKNGYVAKLTSDIRYMYRKTEKLPKFINEMFFVPTRFYGKKQVCGIILQPYVPQMTNIHDTRRDESGAYSPVSLVKSTLDVHSGNLGFCPNTGNIVAFDW